MNMLQTLRSWQSLLAVYQVAIHKTREFGGISLKIHIIKPFRKMTGMV
jgi:hypothetical protein